VGRPPAAYATSSDTGPVRSANEDAVLVLPLRPQSAGRDASALAAVVADGMGGHAAGDVASSLAVRAFVGAVGASLSAAGDHFDPAAAIEEGFSQANAQVLRAGRSSSDRRGMGTTLTGAVIHRGRLYVGHVGDSRAYLVRAGRARALTRDHNLAHEKMRRGLISPQEVALSGERNRLTRAVGVRPSVVPDIVVEQVVEGDVLLLSTDGLHNAVSDREIAQAVAIGPDPRAACARLVALARQRDGSDNATVACIPLGTTRSGRRAAPRGVAALAVALSLALLLVGAVLLVGRPTRPPPASANPRPPALRLKLRVHEGRARAELSGSQADQTSLLIEGQPVEPGREVDLPARVGSLRRQELVFELYLTLGGGASWVLDRRDGEKPKALGVSFDGRPLDRGGEHTPPGRTEGSIRKFPEESIRFFIPGEGEEDIPVEIRLPDSAPTGVSEGARPPDPGGAERRPPTRRESVTEQPRARRAPGVSRGEAPGSGARGEATPAAAPPESRGETTASPRQAAPEQPEPATADVAPEPPMGEGAEDGLDPSDEESRAGHADRWWRRG